MKKSKTVFHELIYKFKKPWNELSFALYFIFAIVTFGGVGVILLFFRKTDNILLDISQNLLTYSIALLVPALISILTQQYSSFKKKLSLVIIIVTILLIEGIIVYCCYFLEALWASIISTLLAWFFWVVANSDNIYLKDETFDNDIRKKASKLSEQW